MKQVLENFNTGECQVEEVPAPAVRDEFVLVRNHYSLISTGTEGGTVDLGKKNLVGKALARPEQAMKVIQVAKTQGLMVAYNAAMRSLEMPIVLGYCTAGEVIAVGQGVEHVKPGDRVACGGAGFANHAEVVCVPKHLCIPVPEKVELRHAAFTTLGSIALQSIRVANLKLGENVVVIGLGLVGMLAVQLLKSAGCRIFGIDIDPDKIDYIKKHGYGDAALANADNIKERVNQFTSGPGADAVIITAATEDNGPVKLAGELARIKGRVVAVGRTRMEAPRETYLFKELELCTSMAYGPGTGDPNYELKGQDYPYGYVRWSEGRNMQAVLDLINTGSLDLESMISHEFNIDEAGQAFNLITGKSEEKPNAVLINYPFKSPAPSHGESITLKPPHSNLPADTLRCSVIGAGSFAINEFLPLLAKQEGLDFRQIVSATGVKAKVLAEKYGFQACASHNESVINDPDTDCIFILTRHDSHASLASAALRAGKHVFVEKPLAMSHAELDDIIEAQQASGCFLMVGFNRRYAPLAVRMKQHFGQRAQPASLHYVANVGYRPVNHWLHDKKQGGGVILGEACHHIDFCNWFIGHAATNFHVNQLKSNASDFIDNDNVHIQIEYADGSLAHIAYLSNGSKAYHSERAEVFCDNRVATLSDFKKLEVTRGLFLNTQRLWLQSDKGHADQIKAFLNAIKHNDHQFPVQSYFDSSRLTLDIAQQLAG